MRVIIRSSFAPRLFGSAMFLIAAPFAFLLLHGGYAQRKGVAFSAAPARGLGMQVRVQDDTVLLSWRREAPVVRSATRAVLQIDDGSLKREIELGPEQLSNGSILYDPGKADVHFALTVYASDGSAVTDQLQVPGRVR